MALFKLTDVFVVFEKKSHYAYSRRNHTFIQNLARGRERYNASKTYRSTEEAALIADVVCCPHCDSKLFIKNGKQGATHKCKACCRVFSSKTGTSLHRLQKPDKFKFYKSLMLESYYPIKQIAKKVGISIQTAFDWRHKILSGTAGSDDKTFEGIAEIDDI